MTTTTHPRIESRPMKNDSRIASRLRLVSILLILIIPTFAFASSEFVIYRFPITGTQGAGPSGNLVADSAGNLYGTTFCCGPRNMGEVFEMIRPVPPSTAWTQTVLYSFGASGDGTFPVGGLIFDGSGNLYGTASRDGAFGFGTVFELSPPATSSGAWTETVLYSFKGPKKKDGNGPFAGLTFDSSGNLFGTTVSGGVATTENTFGCGVVFELTPPATAGGAWTETVI